MDKIGKDTLDCDNQEALPDLSIQIDDELYTLTPDMYMINHADNKYVMCSIGIMPLDLETDIPDSKPYVILGVQFLKHFYTVFDRDNDQVGFATPTFE